MEKQDSDSSDMRHDSQLKKRRKSPERDGERKREKQTRSTGWLVADSGRGGRLIRERTLFYYTSTSIEQQKRAKAENINFLKFIFRVSPRWGLRARPSAPSSGYPSSAGSSGCY